MVRECVPIPQKVYNITKRLQTPEEVELLSRSYGFYRFYRTANSKTLDKDRRKMYLFGQKEKTCCKESDYG